MSNEIVTSPAPPVFQVALSTPTPKAAKRYRNFHGADQQRSRAQDANIQNPFCICLKFTAEL
jgi:hypothetical protein